MGGSGRGWRRTLRGDRGARGESTDGGEGGREKRVGVMMRRARRAFEGELGERRGAGESSGKREKGRR